MKKRILVVPLLAIGCVQGDIPATPAIAGEVQIFNIAAKTQSCQGVAPQRCLVVNGEWFYGDIEGYDHIEGRAAKICVMRSARPDPLPADVGRFVYQKVNCA